MQQQETQSAKDHGALAHPVTVAFEILDAEQETYHFIIDVIDACEGLTESETLVASKDLTVSLDRETYASPRLHVAARVDESTGYLCDTCDPFGFEKGMVLGAISHMHGWGDVKNPRREVRVVPISALQGRVSSLGSQGRSPSEDNPGPRKPFPFFEPPFCVQNRVCGTVAGSVCCSQGVGARLRVSSILSQRGRSSHAPTRDLSGSVRRGVGWGQELAHQ